MVGGVGGGLGAACSLALILALAVVLGLWWLVNSMARDRCAQRKAKIEGHIDKLYEEIRAKAVAAAAADYSGLPQPLFDLLTTLTEKLGPLINLGGPMGLIVERIRKTLNRATTFTSPKHPTPAEGGTSILVQLTPPAYQTVTQEHPSANSELERVARDFNAFWENKPHVTDLIRETLKKLGGDHLC